MKKTKSRITIAVISLITAAALAFAYIPAPVMHGSDEVVAEEDVEALGTASPAPHDLTIHAAEMAQADDVETRLKPEKQDESGTPAQPAPETMPSPTPEPTSAPSPEPDTTPTPSLVPSPEPEPEPALSPEPAKTPVPSPAPEQRRYNNISEGDVFAADITHYDVCMHCCGKLDGVTASGLVIKNGVEPEIPVASCNWLPLGTLVDVDETTYIIADRGGDSLNLVGRLDIFVPDGHQAALELGRIRGKEITILKLPG